MDNEVVGLSRADIGRLAELKGKLLYWSSQQNNQRCPLNASFTMSTCTHCIGGEPGHGLAEHDRRIDKIKKAIAVLQPTEPGTQ